MLNVYRYLTYFFSPLLVSIIFLRTILNKEDKLRFKEKIFSSNFRVNKDNKKKLIWFHASSIGECLSILPLINELNKNYKNINFLITSVTLSSSRLLEKKLDKYQNIVHRFFPLDIETLSEKFLNSWKPDVVCFIDSEIWPNFLFKIKEKKIPLLLLNARLTKKSFDRWKIIFDFAKKVFGNFDLCLAASEESKNNLDKLKVKNLKYIGNLKYSAESIVKKLSNPNKEILDNYKTWCAASTHSEEENIVLEAHIEIKKEYKNVLTIIIPRHIDRSNYILNLCKKFSLNVQILNDNELISSNLDVLVINSFGILPKYFDYCKNIFIGKSFIKEKQNVGGQNPLEAAKLGCKIFHGPYVYNFQEVYNYLKSLGVTEEVNNEKELAEKVITNFKSPESINQKQIDLLNDYGKKILKQTVVALDVYLK
jgi:3-deoxy-D-manno-octulosonic-acid transferase